MPPPYLGDWHQGLHQPKEQRYDHPPLQASRGEEGEGGAEQLLQASPPWEQGHLQRQEQPRLGQRGFHQLVILSDFIHLHFQHNTDLDSSPAAMVMHRLTLVVPCPAWQGRRVNDSNLLEVLKCKNLYFIVLQCNKFVTFLLP